ncbi:MAG: ABC transporter permease [[Clostridium] spiroforme]|uniref:ABC transporter permease n=1 Tax=Thomasclavelia spiroformis TaxID=29348 RepID=A0A943EHI2_9FIRM|nr:ABC transporter permease subunit [Thomasclavelia spiroformis]MBS5587803.1 ABC transporter permease [Thomasclavelia spiroformis]
MKVLMFKTFTKMFKVLPFVIISILSSLLGFLFSNIYENLMRYVLTFDRFSNNILNIYSLFAFMIIAGILIWVICSNCATGLFASEIHEGTMRLLLSKEISRFNLVLSKILGMLLGSFVYLINSFSIFMLIFCLFTNVEKDILLLIIKATILFIIYGIVVIFIVGGVGAFLSSVFKKKVPAILIMICLGGLIFGIIPILRIILISQGYYSQFHLYFLDINYHFGLIFKNFLSMLGDLSLSQNVDQLFTIFTNLYTQGMGDIDIILNNTSYFVINNSLNSLVIVISYIIGAIALYGLSFRIMMKKDI